MIFIAGDLLLVWKSRGQQMIQKILHFSVIYGYGASYLQ